MIDKIKGVGVALVTPFDEEGRVDYDALGRVVNHVLEGGVDYLVALGTTAETPTLTVDEKKGVVETIKEYNRGRAPIMLGIGGYDTAQLLRDIENTDFTGIGGVLSVTPFYNRPSQEGLFQHYKTIAEHSPKPIMLYNVPARTGVNLHADTTLRIAHEVDNVMGIKEASGIMGQMAKIINGRPEGFRVVSGDDVLAVPLTAIGGDGVISVAANAFPKYFCKMVNASFNNDRESSVKYYHQLLSAMNALFEEGNPTGVKTALAIKGITTANVRQPLVKGTKALHEKLERIIKEQDL